MTKGTPLHTTYPDPGPLPERMAILRLTPEALAALLQLPQGSYIDAVAAHVEMPGMLHLRVRGAGYEVRPGEVIPRAPAATVRMLSDGENRWPVIDWHLPEVRITTAAEASHA